VKGESLAWARSRSPAALREFEREENGLSV
jgi:hypothetical protein